MAEGGGGFETKGSFGKATWGVVRRGAFSKTIEGCIVSITERNEASTYPETDTTGAICGLYKYDTHKVLTLVMEISSNSTLPKIGDGIEMKTGDEKEGGFVSAVEVLESNNSYQRLSITIESYLKCKRMTDKTK